MTLHSSALNTTVSNIYATNTGDLFGETIVYLHVAIKDLA